MKYLGGSFSMPLGGQAYRDGWDRVFGDKQPAGIHCHAGGEQHGPAEDRGSFGVLCDSCWERVRRIVDRVTDR